MQRPKSSTILSRSSHLLAHLFDSGLTPVEPAQPTQLPIQPTFQRQRFLQQAIAEARPVFTQLMPATTAGHLTNVTGTIKPLAAGRYVIQTDTITYWFAFNQLRYIAGATMN